jgi:hypothetical protein
MVDWLIGLIKARTQSTQSTLLERVFYYNGTNIGYFRGAVNRENDKFFPHAKRLLLFCIPGIRNSKLLKQQKSPQTLYRSRSFIIIAAPIATTRRDRKKVRLK